ncbi:MAG: TusE/DsrC/DsvC family sulfur relay protein [Burkholderiales bacterium]|nr:TusE/DsrC/DsvC family sulfur relay protein [Burkholderiales bacterium]
MEATVVADHRVASRPTRPSFDERSNLVDTGRWDPALAEALACEAGIEQLGPEHWRAIEHVRGKYHALGSLPVMRLVCRAAGIEPGSAQTLFRGCASLWRIAGLPNPGEEALAYMH